MKVNAILSCTMILVASSNAYKYFQTKIPNGELVPHPCKPNYIWHGVGHRNAQGGGTHNPFGEDFKANGKSWDATLCGKDSDGDGRTNGQELGDPNCVWKEGDTPEQTTGITHPGVCEPTDSEKCKANNQWEFCTDDEFKCDGILEPEVRNVTLRLDDTAVPAQETTYVCQAFEVPSDQDYHIVAWTPALDNRYIMHHMLMFSCSDPEAARTTLDRYKTAKPCGMGGLVCQMVGGWTLGQAGICNPPEYGQDMGNSTVKVMLLQVHWNNPEKRSDYRDHSGMTLYYTPKLRPNSAATLIVGQMYLNIPPGQGSHTEHGVCSAACTKKAQTAPIFLSDVSLHMHYLGNSGRLEVIRQDKSPQLLAEDEVYAYDSPVTHNMPSAVQLNPGDSLRIKCEYKSTSKTERTFYGDATSAEMCYAFINYYPATQKMAVCVAVNEMPVCNGVRMGEKNSCKINSLSRELVAGALKNLTTECDQTGKVCKDTCRPYLKKLRSSHDCFQGDMFYFTELALQKRNEQMARVFRLAAHSCDGDDPGSVNDDATLTLPCVITLPMAFVIQIFVSS